MDDATADDDDADGEGVADGGAEVAEGVADGAAVGVVEGNVEGDGVPDGDVLGGGVVAGVVAGVEGTVVGCDGVADAVADDDGEGDGDWLVADGWGVVGSAVGVGAGAAGETGPVRPSAGAAGRVVNRLSGVGRAARRSLRWLLMAPVVAAFACGAALPLRVVAPAGSWADDGVELPGTRAAVRWLRNPGQAKASSSSTASNPAPAPAAASTGTRRTTRLRAAAGRTRTRRWAPACLRLLAGIAATAFMLHDQSELLLVSMVPRISHLYVRVLWDACDSWDN